MTFRVLIAGAVLGQPMGGVRRHNAELLPRVAALLAARGASLAILEGTQPIAFELPGTIVRIPSNVPPRPALVRATLEGRCLRRVLKEARETGRPFDLVHTAHFPVPRHLPVPYSLTLHDLKLLETRHTPMSRRLIGQKVVADAVRGAAVVLAVSESLREELGARFRVDLTRVRTLPNAADHLARVPRLPGDPPFLLYVGHLEPRKNVELLLHALDEDKGLPELRLAGGAVGDARQRLEDLALRLGVWERVSFLGPRDDAQLTELYSRTACVVHPSRREGFGIPVLEARRARAPLAVARIPALLEVAGEGVASFDPDDARECAASVRAAMEMTGDELERAGESADAGTWDDSASRWVEAWETALAAGHEHS